MFPDLILRTGSGRWTGSRVPAQGWISNFISSCHVETICLLSKLSEAKHHMETAIIEAFKAFQMILSE